MASVVLIGTLDTKGEEYAFVRDRIVAAGCEVVMVNAGALGDPDYPVEYGRGDVARAAGHDLDELVASGDRGDAVSAMGEGAARIAADLHRAGRLDAVLGMGGSGGSSIVSRAMRALPIGVPKVLVSTMGAGDVSAFVGTSDIAMTYSVVDIAGVNRVSARILANAAASAAAMAKGATMPIDDTDGSHPLVGATMYGTTTPCVNRSRGVLADRGFEVLVFHATGTGGRSMESLVASGHITAVLDVTTTELMDEVAGGTLTAGPDRLEIAGRLGIPQVVSLGAVDQITFTPHEAVPAHFADRHAYVHNPSIVLVRSNADECEELGRVIAGKLNRAEGPVSLFVPLRGTSSYAVPGGVFHDPEADRALFGSLRAHLDRGVDRIEIDADINDPVFAEAMADRLDELYRRWATARRMEK
jgi:uncharacterized protein (UPF0261 family)